MNEQLRMAFPVLWPAMAIAGAVLLVAWWPRANRTSASTRPGGKGWAGALAFGLAFTAAFAIIVGGMPRFPPPERWQWLLPMIGAATGFGVLAGFAERLATARWIIGVLSAAVVGYLFHPLASITQPMAFRMAVAAAVLIIWIGMEGTARRHRGFTTPLLLSITFTGMSIVILQGHNANISLLAASVSAALGVACVLALLLPPLTLAGGATHVLAALLATIAATAWMYGIGEKISLSLLAATPLIVRSAEWVFSKTSGWRLVLVRVPAAAIPVAAAIVYAVLAAAREEPNPFGY